MVREVQQAGKGAGPRRPAPLRGVEQPARAERHGPLCLRHDGRDDLGADETTWSCDGLRGYIYGFFTDDIALFRFRGTRRKFVAGDVFGPGERHFGVLVRDRYSAYDNSFRGRQQYCFEHLKRDCLELLEKEPDIMSSAFPPTNAIGK